MKACSGAHTARNKCNPPDITMSDCLTCTKSTVGEGLVLAVGADREVQNALCEHFWFDDDQCLESLLCYQCWQKIEDFHRFYCEVRKLHSRPLYSQAPIGFKQETHPVGVVLELLAEQAGDCTVVENDEMCLIKYETRPIDFTTEPSEQPSECIDTNENENDQRGKKRPRLRENETKATQERSETHMQYHLDPDLFKCEYCSKQHISQDALKKHLRLNHNANKTSPITVAKEVESGVIRTEGSSGKRKSDALEILNSSGDEDDKGDDGPRKTKLKFAASNRMNITPQENAQMQAFLEKHRILECETCSERCIRITDFQKHCLEKHNKSATVQCCNRTFQGSTRFVSHILHHINPERFKCTECPTICASWDALKCHLQTMHTPEGKNKYPCYSCERRFRSKLAARRHAEEHGAPAPPTDDDVIDKIIAENYTLECDSCQKRHDSYKALQQHSTTEHGKPSNVTCCRKKMGRRSELLDHYRYHQDPNTFMCKVCRKAFHHSISLRNHMKTIHPAEWEKICSAGGS